MLPVKTGIVVYGPTFTGKSTIIRTLRKLLEDVDGPIDMYQVNPKSISSPLMFGSFDPLSHEFYDGVLGSIMR